MEYIDSFDAVNYSRRPKSVQLYLDEAIDPFTEMQVFSVGISTKMVGLNKTFPYYFTFFGRDPEKNLKNITRKQIFNRFRFTPVAINNAGVCDGYIELDVDLQQKGRKKPIINAIQILFDDKKIMSPVIESDKNGIARWHINASELSLLKERVVDTITVVIGDDMFAKYKLNGHEDLYRHLPKDTAKSFQSFVIQSFDLLKEKTGWEPKQIRITNEGNDAENYESFADYCYVYLMHDSSNGFYKIGMSNNPEYRESTLQGEKPTIEKVCERKYPSRKIAASIESSLHKVFDAKRIRGEWFRLEPVDVWQIKETLK